MEENQNQQHQPVIVVGEPEQDKRQTNSLSVCSLVLGILSLVFCLIPYVSLIIGIVGVIQGIISLVQHRPGRGMAIGGVVTGVFGTLISLLMSVLIIVGMMILN